MINYSLGKDDLENWVVSETAFQPDSLGKAEAIMHLGNGYLGLRSSTEEPYMKETRNLFVAGTFNKAEENEVTELPNIADATRLDIRVDGERFSLEFGKTKDYIRQLNLKYAELIRFFEWTSPKGKILQFEFKRFVSLDNLHLIGMKMIVKSLSDPVQISFDSGIDAQMSNSGAQHFLEGERRIFDKKKILLVQTTNESKIDVVINSSHKVIVNDQEITDYPEMNMARRKVWLTYNINLQPNDKMELEKLTTVYTSRDKEYDNNEYNIQLLMDKSLEDLRNSSIKGYDSLFQSHKEAWNNSIWNAYKLEINSENPYDQLALRFSLYQLTIMAPAHDDRMGVAAKALSGEGYKGHSFWDTEIFILPFFTFSNPAIAKSLLTYRYYGLDGAREKARENGYCGAMFPWEAAWPTDGEVTPKLGDIDIVTGKQTKIWSGVIEQHISADIAFAIYQYFNVTADHEFMDQYGYEIIFETAIFWASRLEWNESKQEYHINNVIGPDEYKEHVNNNAFTNYMAFFNIKLAIRYYETLMKENTNLIEKLTMKIDLKTAYQNWRSKAEKIYLPKPREKDLVIPQDDTYLKLKEIDLTKYKNQEKLRTIYLYYNPQQINTLQVTKQTDTLLLIYLLRQTFLHEDIKLSDAVKKANFYYYEPKTLHDSSLSLATHSILANDIGDTDFAYSLFKKATEVDLGPSMNTSDDGIHAASIGGIWKAAVFGFAGIRLVDGKLTINPKLPKQWNHMNFTIHWQGQPIAIFLTDNTLSVKVEHKKKIEFEVYDQIYECDDEINIEYEYAKR
ncbi:glycoside hydrolase family 65 protein [Psychrobacillus sp. NPDC096623]|uniref:glycoside hydrolase family 65 protein n=1 Tax=Psychrobacillus sp. NPDC096623 TaxID=3364492 RepID=UPI003804462C